MEKDLVNMCHHYNIRHWCHWIVSINRCILLRTYKIGQMGLGLKGGNEGWQMQLWAFSIIEWRWTFIKQLIKIQSEHLCLQKQEYLYKLKFPPIYEPEAVLAVCLVVLFCTFSFHFPVLFLIFWFLRVEMHCRKAAKREREFLIGFAGYRPMGTLAL